MLQQNLSYHAPSHYRAMNMILIALALAFMSDVACATPPAWDENWQVTFPVSSGSGRGAFGAGSVNDGDINGVTLNHALAKAEVIIDAFPFGAGQGHRTVGFTRKFTLPAGGPYCVEMTTSLIGDLSIQNGKYDGATVDALVVLAPVDQASILSMRANANKRYWTVLPRDGTSFSSGPGGWTGFGGTGYVLAPGQYEIRGLFAASAITTNGSTGVDAQSRFFTTGFRVDVNVRAPALLAQPAFEVSSIVCHPDATAPARSLGRRGIMYDFNFAQRMNAAMTDVNGNRRFDTLNFQFNQCFGGGMIDDLFNPVAAPTIAGAANRVTASAAAQHNEQSFSLGNCAGGMAWGRHFTWAVWKGAITPQYAMGKAAWYAERKDVCGPIIGPCGTKTEHPQFQSNGVGASQFANGTHTNRRALVFVGQHTSTGAVRPDYFNDIRTIRLALRSTGYTDANIQYFAGPGYAANMDPCSTMPGITFTLPVALGTGTRANLIAAIAALPTAAAGTKEYYVWIGDHGQRWRFTVAAIFGLGNPVIIPPINLIGPRGAGAQGPGFYIDHFPLDQEFIDQQQVDALLYVENESAAPHPVRITINGVVIFDTSANPDETLNPGDTVIDFPSDILHVGDNEIMIENLSTFTGLTLTAVGVGTDAVDTGISGPPGDLNGDAAVDALDLAEFMAAFGASRDDEEGFPDARFNAAADYDEDFLISLVDYQIWLEHFAAFQNP